MILFFLGKLRALILAFSSLPIRTIIIYSTAPQDQLSCKDREFKMGEINRSTDYDFILKTFYTLDLLYRCAL